MRNLIIGFISLNRVIVLIIDKVVGIIFIDIWDLGKWLVGGSLGVLNLIFYLIKSEVVLIYVIKIEVNVK